MREVNETYQSIVNFEIFKLRSKIEDMMMILRFNFDDV